MTATAEAVQAPAEQRLRLSGVSWKSYEAFLALFEGRHIRLTYDRGELEIMTTSFWHERLKKLLARFIEAFTEELDIPVIGGGQTTCNREDVERGLEPDECWYIEHEELMRDREQVDLTVDPPPDLAVEIEVSCSVLNRLGIYAALGVPEVWRYDGQTLRVLHLREGAYTVADHSLCFPQLPLDGFAGFLARRGQVDETTLVKSLRTWVRGL